MNESRFYVVSLHYSDGSSVQLIGVYSSLERAQGALGRISLEKRYPECRIIRAVVMNTDEPEEERSL